MMTIRLFLAAFAVLRLASNPSPIPEVAPSITIDKIESNVRITGHVHGIPAAETAQYKVVVYVLTDRWYVHPFADGGNGKSWAAIAGDGSWNIGTVKRDFPAKKVAAVVIPKAYDAPARLETLDPLPTHAITVKEIHPGDPDYDAL